MEEKSRVGVLENAPPWWPHWKESEFTEEDLCEIERYCKKILENVSNEKGMTPWERWKTTTEWGIPDRPHVRGKMYSSFISRVLDCWSDSLKPGIDMFWYPKLNLKAHLAWVARFNLDLPEFNVITYGDLEFGGSSRAKLLPYAAIAQTDPAVKTEEDWDRIHVPDLHRDGFYPPYLWMIRKAKEFFRKHGVADIMPVWAALCPMPTDIAIYLYGYKNNIMFWRRKPEILHRCAQFDLPFRIQYGKTLLEAGADIIMCCTFGAVAGLEAFKPFAKYWLEFEKALTPPGTERAPGFDQSQSLEYMCETGAIGNGVTVSSTDNPTELVVRAARKYKKYFSTLMDPLVVLNGPPEKIIQAVKDNVKAQAGPGFFFGLSPMDYWTPMEHYDLAIRTAKEYGRELYKGLK